MNLDKHSESIEEARLLLPWYITGKLSPEEHNLVEQVLEHCPSLQEEYQRELKVLNTVRDNASLLQLKAVDTTEQRLDKLMKRIEQDNVTTSAPTPKQAPFVKPAAPKPLKLRGLLDRILPSFDWLTPANAVFATLLIVQAGFIGLVGYDLSNKEQQQIYHSASVADDVQAVKANNGTILLIDFKEEAQIKQVRDFLLQWNAHIVDGPDDNNLFRIEVRDIAPDNQHSNLILQQMQQDQGVIGFVGREF